MMLSLLTLHAWNFVFLSLMYSLTTVYHLNHPTTWGVRFLHGYPYTRRFLASGSWARTWTAVLGGQHFSSVRDRGKTIFWNSHPPPRKHWIYDWADWMAFSSATKNVQSLLGTSKDVTDALPFTDAMILIARKHIPQSICNVSNSSHWWSRDCQKAKKWPQ